MSDLIAVYKNMHDRDLEIDVSDDTSGSFKKAMISLLQGNRDTSKTINKQQVAKDASDLIQAGEKMLGTDEVVFNRILCASAFEHIVQIASAYKKISGKTLKDAIEKEFSGDIKNTHLAILNMAHNAQNYFARDGFILFRCPHL